MTPKEFLAAIEGLAMADRYEDAVALAQQHSAEVMRQAMSEEFFLIASLMKMVDNAADWSRGLPAE